MEEKSKHCQAHVPHAPPPPPLLDNAPRIEWQSMH